MKYLDPQRQVLGNGRETWLDHPFMALPGLILEPRGGIAWQIMVMVEGSWVYRECLDGGELLQLLGDWRESPEEALLKWFGKQAPRWQRGEVRRVQLPAAVGTSSESADDLGL